MTTDPVPTGRATTEPPAGPARARPRPVEPADLPALAAMNDAAAPAVNRLGLDGLAVHVPRCDLAVVIDDDGGSPAGFLLALAPGADYDSENYRWFSSHRPGSLYVDRIVVAPDTHGQGLGRALYAAADECAAALGLGEITCEVNLEPPNPGSLAFHSRLGFTQVGEQSTKGGSVRVALLARPLPR
ncbi:GNAT family N-acetyltransferase [Cellulomonas fimi]|uniref:GNAT family N-acetyltransferase n=1 Tax=Cellulomonas fimi TaxID=1708 RepID=A0A7Y0LZ45_CELFI|nr:GNAT family N-acetyltransferase [Cellulomonas fimi]NMR20570.1 GNAT family N-acetyltransferase [Cellulomonas fimi]